SANPKEETSLLEQPLILDSPEVQRFANVLQGYRNASCRYHCLKQVADDSHQLAEGEVRVCMFVTYDVLRMPVGSKCHQRACKLCHFRIEAFGMDKPRAKQVSEHGDRRIDGMQQPELSDLRGREIGERCCSLPALLGKSTALGDQYL